MKYDALTKYIELFSDDKIGEWALDDETSDHPIRMPFVVYSSKTKEFIREVYSCTEDKKFNDYVMILNRNGIEWSEESMKMADAASLPIECILALLLGAVRAEHFRDGILLDLIKSGCVKGWLTELKKRDKLETKAFISLDDLLKIPDSISKDVKIRFNQNDGYNDPMDLYLSNPEIVNSEWLFWRNKQRFFSVGQIAICLLKMTQDTWLLTTIKRVTEELGVCDGINYIGEELSEYKQYFGRVIVKYHRTTQAQGVYYNTVRDDLEVLQVLPVRYDGDEFCGYDNVRLSYTQLKNIIMRQKKSWVAALENQKAVYLITDKSNGKLYVGSATSDKGMLLSRWSEYVENGHGNNVELKSLVDENGLDYVKQNFQYSILENYNSKVDDHVILDREKWWKKTLQSRVFGYNKN